MKKMKKIILAVCMLSVIFLLANCDDGKVFVEIPDANFKSFLLKKIDSNNDGHISLLEAKAVKEMDCSARNIQTLKGIEKFKNLEMLNCSYNPIVNLESELKKNRKIITLVFRLDIEVPDANFKSYLLENFDANNDGILTLAEAYAVTIMNCSGRNIESLVGIECFANLEYLDCSNNQLDELELRYNKKINKLVCTNNSDGMLWVHFAMSSPLRNRIFKRPPNSPPSDTNWGYPIDVNKCIFDVGKTAFDVDFNE